MPAESGPEPDVRNMTGAALLRPSFASPTKASLARHNPEVLQQRHDREARAAEASRTRPQQRREPTAGSASAQASVVATAGEESRSLAAGHVPAADHGDRADTEPAPPQASGAPAPPSSALSDPPGDVAPALPTSSHPAAADPAVARALTTKPISAGSSLRLSAAAGRSSPRPLPPPAPDGEDDLVNPFLSRSRAAAARGRSRITRSGLLARPPQHIAGDGNDDAAEAEPDLPPTPTEKGLEDPVVTTTPTGIHPNTSSPIRRVVEAAKRRSRDADVSVAVMKGSPLKQPPITREEDGDSRASDVEPSPSAKRQRRNPPRRSRAATAAGVPAKRMQRRSTAGKEPRGSLSTLPPPIAPTHPARGIPAFDPNAAKVAQRDALLAQIAALEEDLAQARAQNDALAALQRKSLARRGRAATADTDQEDTSLDKKVLRTLVERYLLPPRKEPEPGKGDPVTEDLLKLVRNPVVWLPFSDPTGGLLKELGLVAANDDSRAQDETSGQRGSQEAGLESEDELAGLATFNADGTAREPKIKSHHPLPMSAAEELPFLQAFTPLTFTSKGVVIINPPQDGGSARAVLQRHIVTATDAATAGQLFTSRIEFTVDTDSLSLVDVAVPRLEPSARAELGVWIESYLDTYPSAGSGIKRNRGVESALANNVSVIAWAMGEWLRAANKRARFWCALERDVLALLGSEGGLRAMAAEMRSIDGRRDHGRRDGADESMNADEGVAGKPTDNWTPAQLLTHMGRTDVDISVSELLAHVPGGHGGRPDGTSLRVHWGITFDWTGTATSDVGLLVGAPGACKSLGTGRSSRFKGRLLTTFNQGTARTNGVVYEGYQSYSTSCSRGERSHWML